jgi:hypothetical protein
MHIARLAEQRGCHASQLFSTGKFRIFRFDFCEKSSKILNLTTRAYGASGRKELFNSSYCTTIQPPVSSGI